MKWRVVVARPSYFGRDFYNLLLKNEWGELSRPMSFRNDQIARLMAYFTVDKPEHLKGKELIAGPGQSPLAALYYIVMRG